MRSFQPGEQLPAFSLPDVHGRRVSLADYRQRRNMLVLLLGRDQNPELDQLLQDIAQHHVAFVDENTILVAMLWASGRATAAMQQRLRLPFALLFDEEGQVHQQLGMGCNQSAPFLIYIVDRAGVVVAGYPSPESAILPTARELLEWVRYIELRCPE